jgi:hypothetical protein
VNVDGPAVVEDVGCSIIHGDACGGTAAATYLKAPGENSGEIERNYQLNRRMMRDVEGKTRDQKDRLRGYRSKTERT